MAKNSTANPQMPRIEDLVVKLKEIELEFKQDLANLHQKLEVFDSKPELLRSLESLKKDA